MFSPNNVPPGCGAIQAEVYFSDKYLPLRMQLSELVDTVLRDLMRCGFIEEREVILVKDAALIRYANVIYDPDRAEAVATVHSYLDEVGISVCGRYGRWDHCWTDEAFVSGEQVASKVLGL